MTKFKMDMLESILLPETIEKFGMEKIEKIKAMGKANNYRLLTISEIRVHPNNNFIVQHQTYTTKRINEITNSYTCKELSTQEKLLFKSQLRFPDSKKIISILKQHSISKEQILELNALIENFQKNKKAYQEKLKTLEKKCNMTYEQVVDIINNYYPLLVNDNYPFNSEDKKTYSNAIYFAGNIRKTIFLLKDSFLGITNNIVLEAIRTINKNYFDIDANHLYIFITKINEIIVTEPQLFAELTNKQKNFD